LLGLVQLPRRDPRTPGRADAAGVSLLGQAARSITCEERLRRARAPLQRFLAVLLVQLLPSSAFEPRPVRAFFGLLAELCQAAVV